MKKTTLVLAVLGSFAGVATAQSTLTLSGGVDVGVRRINDDTSVGTAGSSRSNIAFSGKEDLGNGMYASFYLNHRFNPNNGTVNPGGNRESTDNQFWRNSYVELGGGFGGLRLGRYLVPLQEYNGGYDAFGTDTVGSVHVDNHGFTDNVRANNAVEYRSPVMGGFQVLGMIAASEGQGVTPTKKPVGAAAKYAAGPFSVAVAYDRRADERATTGLYGSYSWGAGTVMGQYQRGENAVTAAGGEKIKAYSISTKIPFGAVDFKAGYARWKQEGETASKFGIGADYNLSKRTQLYVDIGKFSGEAGALLGTDDDLAKKTRADIGIYHRF